jgi:hypothetical protein
MKNRQSLGASPLWQNKQINKDSVAATNAWNKRKAEYMNRKEHMGKPISAEENLAEWNREKNEFYYDTQRNKLRLVPTDDGEIPIKGFKEGLNKWQLPPLNQNRDKKYKKGDILGEGMPEIEATGINIENFSDVQKDKQGQFVTTLGDDEHAPGADTSRSTIMPNALRPNVRVARDTIRPSSGKKFTISNKKTNYSGGSLLNKVLKRNQ